MKTVRLGLIALFALIVVTPLAGQEKRALDHDDYEVWNRIQNDVLSADGQWLAYRLVPGDGDATLILRSLRDDQTLTIERGAQPRFTADGDYLVALVVPMEEAVDAAREDRDSRGSDLTDSLVVVSLADMSKFTVADVQSFRVPEDAGGWMAYLLDENDNDAADDEDDAEEDEEEDDSAPRLDDGETLVVRSLESGAERRFEHAVDYTFAADGSVLAFTASGQEGAADGVYRVGGSGAAETVSDGEGRYTHLAVSDGGTIAFLSDRSDRGREEPRFALYAAMSGTADARAQLGTGVLPAGWAPSDNGDVSFSESGNRVFFGTAVAPEPEPEDDTPEDERVVVDIWNWKDPYLQPMQLLQAEDELTRTYSAMLDLGTGTVVQLETMDVPNVAVAGSGDGSVALGTSALPYRQLISWDGRYADLYVVDAATGSRRLIEEQVRGGATISPGGQYVTRWDGFETAWFATNTATGERIDLTGSMGVPFHDLLDDHPDALRSYGAAGWTEDDERFVVYDQFDIWAIDPTGQAAPKNLTEGVGRSTETRFRFIDLDSDDPVVPTTSDVYLNAFHLYTKENGVYRDRFDGTDEPEQLIWDDARFRGFRMADNADVLAYTRSTFQEFPDIWIADEDFEGRRKVTDANPQQDEYLWGSAELVEWSSNDGIPLQGILYKPEGFDPTQEYPMMVYFYERMSDNLHNYTVPAPGGSSINTSFYVSRGYLLFVPDIPYRIGYPGESALDAVVPGVLSIADKGFVDRDKIGVQGHSWGGYQIAYMVTRTDLFAAAEAGAPVANMVSAYGGIRWGSGMSRMMQYEHTQSRIGGSLWEKPLRYIENSPIFTADKIRTPVLMMHNDQDTAVPWEQGIELFVALRRLGQPSWLLNYNGEPHGLRKRQNQKDWAMRMQQFFDHYLMDAPAPIWLDEGVPAMLKGKTLGLGLKRVISEEDGARR
jgi:dipeptidyl aminopeptidase/acylaminoacyl peptidase